MSAKSTNTYNRKNWEDAEFPILCQTCLGANPYVRMMREKYGTECKICTRPFTVFRWCPGPKSRYKKTEICQTCAKIKNVCQTCLFDLDYGLPVQVRDHVLRRGDLELTKDAESGSADMPRCDVNREYYLQQADRELAKTDGTVSLTDGSAGGPVISAEKHQLLMRMARTQPYYKRNRPHICSFWVKGECKRGEECPYRHERPESDVDDPLSQQNIRDRYYGNDDPVAAKIMGRASQTAKVDEPPEDKSITTLYIGNIHPQTTADEVRSQFYCYGEIRAVNVIGRQNVAFIEYAKREDAELAMRTAWNNIVIHGHKVVLKWGRSQSQQNTMKAVQGPSPRGSAMMAAPPPPPPPVPGLPAPLPPLPSHLTVDRSKMGAGTTGSSDFLGLAQNQEWTPTGSAMALKEVYYQSQDPNRLGSNPRQQQQPK